MRNILLVAALAVFGLIGAAAPAVAQPPCPISYGGLDDAKPNKLYVYFPAMDDTSFPEFGGMVAPGVTLQTSPATRFDSSQLTSYTGTDAQLRDAITQDVAAAYCEFNVQVRPTTTTPPTTFPRRKTIAVGTDTTGPCSTGPYLGYTEIINTDDTDDIDFGRVWAGGYQLCPGGPGGALNGANSTVERWARSIGRTVAHEGGHNFGLTHFDGTQLAPGEDAIDHHMMATGGTYSWTNRAEYRGHFSDWEYSILAANVGLSVQTMWNWDLINPNAQTGVKLQMDFLSPRPSLIMSWSYGGSKSPWINPTLSGPLGTQTFKGVTYNTYRLEWSTGHAWLGGTAGQVSGGASFHVGATFSSVNFSDPDPIIVTGVTLIDATNNPLALHPRIPAFDTGAADVGPGLLTMQMFITDGEAMQIKRLRVQQLPRLMSLDSMVPGQVLRDLAGTRIRPWKEGARPDIRRGVLDKDGEFKVQLASLNQRPHVTQRVTEQDCARGDKMGRPAPDVARCRVGVQYDLFPSTAVLVTAEVVDPLARHWDPKKKRYVVGPVTTTVYYQMAGRRRTDGQRGTPR